MKCSARRKCQHCKEFYLPDRRNLHHQRLLRRTCLSQTEQSGKSAPLGAKTRTTKTTSAARKIASVSKSGEYAIPGTGRKKNPPPQEPLQDLCRTQVAQDEEVKRIEISDSLQDVLVMQPAVMVGFISMMT
jgi:hypothetical protein